MKDKHVILAAKVFSILFSPHYFPLLSILILISFTPLRMFGIDYQIVVLAFVYVFTIALPTYLISLYRRFMARRNHKYTRRELRTIPYIITITCYMYCFYVMAKYYVPTFIISVVNVSLFVQIACMIVNKMYHISAHAAAVGAINGALIVLSLYNSFNPMWWLCLTLLIAGCVCTSRVILRRHSLNEVYVGFCVGFIASILAIHVL